MPPKHSDNKNINSDLAYTIQSLRVQISFIIEMKQISPHKSSLI